MEYTPTRYKVVTQSLQPVCNKLAELGVSFTHVRYADNLVIFSVWNTSLYDIQEISMWGEVERVEVMPTVVLDVNPHSD